jgi:hypothetical protein
MTSVAAVQSAVRPPPLVLFCAADAVSRAHCHCFLCTAAKAEARDRGQPSHSFQSDTTRQRRLAAAPQEH